MRIETAFITRLGSIDGAPGQPRLRRVVRQIWGRLQCRPPVVEDRLPSGKLRQSRHTAVESWCVGRHADHAQTRPLLWDRSSRYHASHSGGRRLSGGGVAGEQRRPGQGARILQRRPIDEAAVEARDSRLRPERSRLLSENGPHETRGGGSPRRCKRCSIRVGPGRNSGREGISREVGGYCDAGRQDARYARRSRVPEKMGA